MYRSKSSSDLENNPTDKQKSDFLVPQKMGNSKKKTSTPNSSRNSSIAFDVSAIQPSVNSKRCIDASLISGRNGKEGNSTKLNFDDASSKKNIHTLDVEYNQLLQSTFLEKVMEESQQRESDAIDEEIAALQKRIAKNEELLQKTKSQFKNIQLNRHIESVIDSYVENCGKISDRFKKSNSEVTCDAVNKELERMRNKITCENIEIPKAYPEIEEFHNVLKQTAEAYKKLSEGTDNIKENNEGLELIKEFHNLNKKMKNIETEKKQTLEKLNPAILKEGCMKIEKMQEGKDKQ